MTSTGSGHDPADAGGPEHSEDPADRVDLGKHAQGSDAELDFDPYRFGLPDHPVPPEYAPPGYTRPAPDRPADAYSPYGPSSPYGQQPPPYGQQQSPYGQQPPPYGAPGYQQPPGYPYPPQPAGEHNSGKAVAAMVCGIASIVLCWLTLFDALLVIPALVLSGIVLSDKRSGRRGMAIAGLICAIVGAALAIALFVWLAPIAKDCSDLSGSDRTQCFRDHF